VEIENGALFQNPALVGDTRIPAAEAQTQVRPLHFINHLSLIIHHSGLWLVVKFLNLSELSKNS
jgi:hypothetical protein